MAPSRALVRRDLERFLRTLCRCDGWKDAAVVVALLLIAGALAVCLVSSRGASTSFS
jgi:hypothetical protein